MKKSIHIFCAMICAALLLAGCTKGAEDLIVGTWNVSSITETVTGHPDPAANTTVRTSYGTDVKLVYTFNKNHTGTVVQTVLATDQTTTSTFNYSVSKQELAIDWLTGPDATRSYVYKLGSVDSKQLSFTWSVDTEGTAGDELGNVVHYTATTTRKYVLAK